MAASRAGSPGWPTLLDAALGLLDDVAQRTGAPVDWALGGGTGLMLHNDRAAGLARDHVEASNFVKLACTDGEIDFIVAPDLTERPRETRALGRREIAVETPVEIVVKKG